MPRTDSKHASRPSSPPDRLILVDSREVAKLVDGGAYELVRWPADDGPTSGTAPRLAILDARGRRAKQARERIAELKRRWPLVDTLVYEPDASGPAVRAWLKNGVRDVLFDESAARIRERLESLLDAQRVLPVVDELARRRVRTSRFEGMLSRSNAMWELFETCARVAPTDANVLVFGETGTGKELLARAVHRRSGRAGRFVAVNCSSLPEALIESELFGYERGAFTGAARAHEGIFRSADGGTVFLDEIGDMPLAAQQSLLRVLEARTVRPVGGTDEVEIDVRVVAATHVNLEEAVLENRFREDLFYRLDVIRLTIPPLRDRPEDVLFLFAHFARRFGKQYGVDAPKPDTKALEELTAYAWPGNVRELENFAERAVLRRKKTLTARDVEEWVRPTQRSSEPTRLLRGDAVAASTDSRDATPGAPEAQPELDTDVDLQTALDPIVSRLEERYLRAVLSECRGIIQDAAARAGLSRRTLQRKMRTHGLRKEEFRSR